MTALEGKLDELHGSPNLVAAYYSLARCPSSAADHPQLLQALSQKLQEIMVELSPSQLASTASACQKLLVTDGALLEGLVRQGQRRRQAFLPRHAEAVLGACDAAGFRHAVVDQLRQSVEEAAAGPEEERDVEMREVAEEDEFPPSPARSGRRGRRRKAAKPLPEPEAEEGDLAVEGPDGEIELPPEVQRLLPKEGDDREMVRLLRDMDRRVLRPAGLRSAAMAGRGRKKYVFRKEEPAVEQ